MSSPSLIYRLLWWPSELIQDLAIGGLGVETVAVAAITLGVPFYLYGAPSLDDGVQALAMSYGVAGVSYIGAQMLMEKVSNKRTHVPPTASMM